MLSHHPAGLRIVTHQPWVTAEGIADLSSQNASEASAV
jgi:hypothetical protein